MIMGVALLLVPFLAMVCSMFLWRFIFKISQFEDLIWRNFSNKQQKIFFICIFAVSFLLIITSFLYLHFIYLPIAIEKGLM